MSEFIFMLTHHDQTIPDALAVFNEVKDAGLKYVGFKDVGLSREQLLDLTTAIHANGQFAVLEIVSQTEIAEMASARLALDLGVDCLLGGRQAAQVSEVIGNSSIRYFPFCGNTRGHPTELTGTIDEIVADAQRLCLMPRVSGLDLLAYRSFVHPDRLIERVCRAVDKPVVVAGSIDGFERLSSVRQGGAWAFTVGGAVFERRFGSQLFATQITEILSRSSAARPTQSVRERHTDL